MYKKPILLDYLFVKKILKCFAVCVFILIILAAYVPLAPRQPNSGLDPSWVFSLNQAVSNGLNFGKDIIFTYGPYASIFTRSFHPATDQLMLWGSFSIGLGFALIMLFLAKGPMQFWLIAFSIYLPMMVTPDQLLLPYPFVLALLIYRLTLPASHPKALEPSRLLFFGIPVFFFFLGLLPLIKVTMFLVAGMVTLMCVLMLWTNQKKTLAVAIIIAQIASFFFFWMLANQNVSTLPNFLASTRQVILGYSDAMSSTGSMREVVIFLISASLILYTVISDRFTRLSSKTFLFLLYTLFLFVTFKGGFIRHDGHAMIAADGVLLAALLLPFIINNKSIILSLVFAAYTWSFILGHYVSNDVNSIIARTKLTYINSWTGLQSRISKPDELRLNFEHRLELIRNELNIPALPGTTDIYSYNQAFLLATQNAWSTRPVFQSYSAYTPELLLLNQMHLLGEEAPDNLLFHIEPIDGRLPSLEDGLSWSVILNNYSARGFIGPYIHFQERVTGKQETHNTAKAIYMTRSQLDKKVILPESDEPLFAEIEIQPTILGRLVSILYKMPQLRISMILVDGSKHDFRIVPSMMETKFLISPLVENTNEFLFLTSPNNYLYEKRVKSITIYQDIYIHKRFSFLSKILWNNYYDIKLYKLEINRDNDLAKMKIFDQQVDPFVILDGKDPLFYSSNVQCLGSLDVVNRVTLPTAPVKIVGNTLSANGWLAIDINEGIIPDEVFVTLTNPQGKTLYIKARHMARDDVKIYFNKPSMPDSGFEILFDVSDLSGIYLLGLTRLYDGDLQKCEQVNIPLLIHTEE